MLGPLNTKFFLGEAPQTPAAARAFGPRLIHFGGWRPLTGLIK